MKGCKTNNKIQIDENIERVQDKQQDTNREKKKNDSKMEFDLWWIIIRNDFVIVIMTHQNTHPKCKQNILYNTCYLVFYLKTRKKKILNF